MSHVRAALGPVFATLVFVAAAVPALAGTAPGAGQAAERLDQAATLYHALGIFDGVVLLARGDEIVFEKGYGMASYELGVPNGQDTVFRVASISKPVTALAIGSLAEDGRLDLDDRLSRFVPEYPHAKRITLRQLVDHRAGVPHLNGQPWYERESRHHIDLEELVGRLHDLPLDFEPGAERSYSNGGYAVLALVIERASGGSYGEEVARRVLEPLGMTASGHDRHDLLLRGRATGYVPGDLAGRRVPAQYVEPSIKIGGGSLYMTARDLLALGRAFYGDGVVKEATWRALLPPRDGEVWKTGRAPGYSASLRRRLADDWTLVVLANNYAINPIDEYLPAILGDEPFELPRYETRADLPEGGWADYAGTYQWPQPWGTKVEIVVAGGHATYVELFRDQRVGLFPQGEDGFYLPLYDAPCRFVAADEAHAVAGIECAPKWSDELVRLSRLD